MLQHYVLKDEGSYASDFLEGRPAAWEPMPRLPHCNNFSYSMSLIQRYEEDSGLWDGLVAGGRIELPTYGL
jgi:hypothetical protein